MAPPNLLSSGLVAANTNADLKGIENTGSVATEENEDQESESSYTISASASISQSDANSKALWNQLAKKYLNKGGTAPGGKKETESSDLSDSDA